MKKMYYVEVLEKDGWVEVISTFSTSTNFQFNLESEIDLLSRGYNPIFMIGVSDRGLYNKYKLKASVLELKATMKKYNAFLESIPLEVKHNTKSLMDSHLETLMRRIARLYSRCLRREIEVTDELAIECYNYVENERRKEREEVLKNPPEYMAHI